MNRSLLLLVLVVASALGGCATVPGVAARDESARVLAEGAGLLPFTLAPSSLPLRGYARMQEDHAALSVYIEGDGRAWIDRHTPSNDPTPINPVGLKLAAVDSSANVVYLGRPGQYIHGGVDRRYWLAARFAPEVVDTYVSAIRELASSLEATSVDITGYSGGGAIAALVTARLTRELPNLPVSLRTVAGNVDTAAWTRLKKISPLEDSLNPADEADALRNVPQLHLTGSRDVQVPRAVFASYAARLGSSRCVREISVDATHAGPWDDAWRAALATPPVCAPEPEVPVPAR